jgi:hypothetical protein
MREKITMEWDRLQQVAKGQLEVKIPPLMKLDFKQLFKILGILLRGGGGVRSIQKLRTRIFCDSITKCKFGYAKKANVASQQKLIKPLNQRECKLSSITMPQRWSVVSMHSNPSIHALCVENLRIM